MLKLVKLLRLRHMDHAAVAALVIGNVAALLGVSIAPTEVSALVTAGATILTLIARLKATP